MRDKSYVSNYFKTTNTIKVAFLFKTKAWLLVTPGNHVIANSYYRWFVGKNDNIFATFPDFFSANKRNIVKRDDKDQLSGDDTILDHIVKVNKGKRQKIWYYVH